MINLIAFLLGGASVMAFAPLGFYPLLLATFAWLIHAWHDASPRRCFVLGFWFVLQLIDGLGALGAETSSGGVAFFAHIGGFVFGVVVGLIARAIRPRQMPGAWVRRGVG